MTDMKLRRRRRILDRWIGRAKWMVTGMALAVTLSPPPGPQSW